MYNHDKITDAIAAEIGFEKSFKYPVPDYLYQSKSGIKYNETQPLINMENLSTVVDGPELADVPVFSETESYKRFDLVSHGASLYEATQDIAPGPWNEAQWVGTNQLGVMLRKVTRSAASEVVDALMTKKKVERTSKALYENLRLFDGIGSLASSAPKSGRFVGLMFDAKNLDDMKLVLHAIGLQLTVANPTLNLYIYHTSQATPLYKIPLENAGGKMFKWHELGIDLPYVGDTAAGGSFMIGYRESELVGNAIVKDDYEWGTQPCVTCSSYNIQAFQRWSRNIDIHPFHVSETEIVNDELWDISLNRYNYRTNHGINLSLSLQCDITDTVVRNAGIFREALRLSVAVKLLSKLAFSTLNATTAEKCRQLALYELDNRDNHTEGLTKKKERAIQALDFDFSSIGGFCFPRQRPAVSKGSF